MPWKRKSAGNEEGASSSKYSKSDTSHETAAGNCDSAGKLNMRHRLGAEFFKKDCTSLAKSLLGKKIVRKLDNGDLLAGHIIETEAYLGGKDKASHSFGGKKTSKNEAMFMEPGTMCVYNMYGTMSCLKVSSQGEGAAVLIRAVDPTYGFDNMRASRGVKRPDKGQGLAKADLGSGPSKLTQALQIDKATFNKENVTETETVWLQEGFDVDVSDIVTTSRVGIESAEEWADKPLRFYVKGNPSVSVRDKDAEEGSKSTADVKRILSSNKQDMKAAGKKMSIKKTQSEESPEGKLSDVKESRRLKSSFFEKSCEQLAKDLLGKKLVRRLDDGRILAGDIVETEAYLGGPDKASHSFGGKKTPKNEAMFMDPGTIYVYNIYGVMTCINISSQGEGAAVLIRALDVTHGLDQTRKNRGVKRPDEGRGLDQKDLGNGPSKLTQALGIDKATFNKLDITDTAMMWLQAGFDVSSSDIVVSSRIGIDSAADWAKKPLRFYVKGNKSVSVKDKEAEK